MLKKLWSLMLALALCLSAGSALAQQAAVLPQAGSAGIALPQTAQVKQNLDTARTTFPKPNDTVVIENGAFIITSGDVTAQFQAPFGWIALSQDIAQQLTDYAMMNDPLYVLNLLIDNGISLLAVDPSTDTNMYAFFAADGLSALLGSIDSQEMLDMAIGAYEGRAVTVGGKNYISVIEDGTLIYFTLHNGARVGFQLILLGDTPTPEEEEILRSFVELTIYL